MNAHYPSSVTLHYKSETVTTNPHYNAYLNQICDVCIIGDRSARICEWGAGFSTFYFYELLVEGRADLLVSIDNNKPYAEAFWRYLPSRTGFYPVVRNEIGPTASNSDVGLHYASHPVTYATEFDLIYIDGRRRMECMVNSLLFSHAQTRIVIDDGRRSRYEIAHLFLDEIEELDHGVIYVPKPVILEAIRDDRAAVLGKLKKQRLIGEPFGARSPL